MLAASCVPQGEDPVFEVVEAEKINVASSSLAVFEKTVYPLVRSKTCVNCHTEQSPQFASANVEEAYIALTRSKKVDEK